MTSTTLAASAMLTVALMTLGAGNATAAFKVNTGAGPQDANRTVTRSARYANDQYLALQFAVGTKTTITGIEGWMSLDAGGQGIVSVRSNHSGLPGSALFSTLFSAPQTNTNWPIAHSEWFGALDLNWMLNAGTYWVAFETDTAQLGGAVGGFYLPTVSSATNEAIGGDGEAWRTPILPLGIGVRVSAVPAPPTLLLFGFCTFGLIGFKKLASTY